MGKYTYLSISPLLEMGIFPYFKLASLPIPLWQNLKPFKIRQHEKIICNRKLICFHGHGYGSKNNKRNGRYAGQKIQQAYD